MPTITINWQRALGPRVIERACRRMAVKLQEQTIDRIREGNFTPLDFPRYDGSQDQPLWHTGSHLIHSISHKSDANSFSVGSSFIGARVHQFGTKGKGGTLPSIVPKRAKALFVPMTPRGFKSFLMGDVAERRDIRMYRKAGKGGIERLFGPPEYRAALKPLFEEQQRAKQSLFYAGPLGGEARRVSRRDLRRADTRLNKRWDKLNKRKFDYLLLQKVDIHPRPFFLVTEDNLRGLVEAGFG
jgi:phage gpG-like protein